MKTTMFLLGIFVFFSTSTVQDVYAQGLGGLVGNALNKGLDAAFSKEYSEKLAKQYPNAEIRTMDISEVKGGVIKDPQSYTAYFIMNSDEISSVHLLKEGSDKNVFTPQLDTELSPGVTVVQSATGTPLAVFSGGKVFAAKKKVAEKVVKKME